MHTSMLILIKTIKFCHQDFAPKILMHFFGGGERLNILQLFLENNWDLDLEWTPRDHNQFHW